MFAVPLKPKVNVKYIKSVTLEDFYKNHEGIFDKKLLETEWNKHNPKPKEVKESK